MKQAIAPSRGFGLYIHWPFCQSKCPYCDFNSHVSAEIDQRRWRYAYAAEIDRLGAETEGRVLTSIYFGGGTPSLMDPGLVASILDAARRTWRQSNEVEVTLEANPSSVETARFAAYRDAGVNRVSIGVQALDDNDLRRLGRMHSVAEALRAVSIGTSVFDRVSFDLIYARQDQSLLAWRHELTSALTLGADHLSLYQLTVEDGTVFQQRYARGQLAGLPHEDMAADMYAVTQELCSDADLPAYEVSNHARPGQESRHNMLYWQGGDYVGVGPGAHGRMTVAARRVATEGVKFPSVWLEAVERSGTGEAPRETLSNEEAGAEYLMMGLRMKEGVSCSWYAALTGHGLDQIKIKELEGLGLLHLAADRVKTTDKGLLLLNAVLRALLVD